MLLHAISRIRFDALASYARHQASRLLATEIGWLSDDLERVLVVVLLDSDIEYSCAILARDLKERYRWVAGTEYFTTPAAARAAAEHGVADVLAELDERRAQGDEVGVAVDFFSPVRERSKLNPAFIHLAESRGYSPARGLGEAMMRWHQDADGNFVEQFQTTGFDARIWELYLSALLNEAGHILDATIDVPDFVVSGPVPFSIEATTINPSQGGAAPPTPGESPDTYREYLAIRYAGPLLTKLSKQYWRLPHVEGRPLVFAIQDFHEPMSMTWTRSALPVYLYGFRHQAIRHHDGSLEVRPEPAGVLRWGSKEVPSGFFDLEGAEHVSAVLFNSSATISKFNRIGQQAGFGAADIIQIQQGYRVDHDPRASEPIPFVRRIGDGDEESWVEGLDVFHNPRALHPLDPSAFPGAAHHRLELDGTVTSVSPSWHPLASRTGIVVPKPEGTEG